MIKALEVRESSMRALICGSLAFDNVMTFAGRFRDHILPDQVHILNVSFLVPHVKRDFGGCAGNIAYNFRLLGGEPLVVGTVGRDGQDYVRRLDQLGISNASVTVVDDALTAQAYIITDTENNQITAFHPGAMLQSHVNVVQPRDVTMAVVGPDGPAGMVQHASALAAAGVPLLFDPGQALPSFDASQLNAFISQATWIVVNDYEAAMLSKTTNRSLVDIANDVEALIITRGAEGSVVYSDERELRIEAVPPIRIADPTGCGDAYRGGLIYALMRGLDWSPAAQLASTLATIKLESPGGQNHAPKREDVLRRWEQAYGVKAPL